MDSSPSSETDPATREVTTEVVDEASTVDEVASVVMAVVAAAVTEVAVVPLEVDDATRSRKLFETWHWVDTTYESP
jgi:hypothetical protein